MLVDGGARSTAGGFKLLRLLIAIKVLRVILLRTCLPRHAVIEPRLAGRRLQDEELVILTDSRNMPALLERWPLKQLQERPDEALSLE